MLDAGLDADLSTFNLLLKAAMRARDTKRARLAVAWMQDAGLVGDEFTYNTLIKVRTACLPACLPACAASHPPPQAACDPLPPAGCL
jgi:hypothetical protein